MAKNIEIIVGTYEDFLVGYKLELKNDTLTLKQSFADKSHSGALKCAAAHGNWVASGGTDDRIFMYDMRTRKQVQIILAHSGTVNALAFTPDSTHILSGGDDGVMSATRINNWTTDGTWQKAHSGSPITHISCHPSGKLALSLGKDMVLRTWNLVKGRVAYKTNLKGRTSLGPAPECLSWSQSGEYFTLSGQRVVEVWSIQTANVVRSHNTPSKPICLTWLNDNTILVGLENGSLVWLSVSDEGTEAKTVEAHKSRVKGIDCLGSVLVTAGSDGELKVWNVEVEKRTLKAIASINIGCRPTCIGLLDLKQFGADYKLNQEVNSKQLTTQRSLQEQPTKSLPRSVVTIEYEDNAAMGKTKTSRAKVEQKKANKSKEIPDQYADSSDGTNSDVYEEEREDDETESDTDSDAAEVSDEAIEHSSKVKKVGQPQQRKRKIDSRQKINKSKSNLQLKSTSKLNIKKMKLKS